MTQWMGFAGSCTVFFHVLEFFLWKAGRHICNAPWQKNEIKTISKRDHSLLHPLPSTHFSTHFSTQFRTCERQPLKRACSALRTHSSTPAQRCTGASQIISSPSSPPAQPCKHARLVQVRGKARCRLEPAVAKETSSLKIAKHAVNAPRRIR